ncbi:hypothetical protein vseg_009408 [Gypsophila vaccaria]
MSPPPHPHHPPPHQPPQYQLYPYPPPHHRRNKGSSKTLASCILATCFLSTMGVAAAITLFILFRPQTPVISTTSVKLPTLTTSTSTSLSLVNFTLLQYSALRNPNRYDFTHHGSSVQLISPSLGPLGFLYIPAGRIPGGGTQRVAAEFEVKSLSAGPGPMMEVETKVRLVGSVKVLKVFAHHVDTTLSCRISITLQLTHPSLLAFHC